MSIDSSTTQLVSTLKPSMGIANDKAWNPMDAVVPNDLEGDYVAEKIGVMFVNLQCIFL